MIWEVHVERTEHKQSDKEDTMEATIWIWGVELESKDAVLEVPCSRDSHYPKSACTEEKHWVSYSSIYDQRDANTAMRKVTADSEKFRIINMFGSNRKLGSVDIISQPSALAPALDESKCKVRTQGDNWGWGAGECGRPTKGSRKLSTGLKNMCGIHLRAFDQREKSLERFHEQFDRQEKARERSRVAKQISQDLKHLREELEGARKRLIGKAVIHKVHLDELGKDESDDEDDLGQLLSLQGEALGFRTAIHFMDRILDGEYKGIGAG